ncbi:hypothetical protein K5M46_04875, partial [Serratia marcescens]|nr:hypothetical protein [Serratia marcescens]MBX9320546.1 hypothetical protein [Serratia marcescens]MBX9326802.1 hypothetical protein [Serratia marcescens]
YAIQHQCLLPAINDRDLNGRKRVGYGKKRVLIIEAGIHTTEALEKHLEKDDFALAKAGDGPKGLEMFFPGNLT